MEVGNLPLYVEEHGDGPPLLLINGYANHVLHWGELAKNLANWYRVITFDNRGMGRSGKPKPPYSIEQMADDAIEVLDALGIAKTFAIGHSMGGCILQHLCHKHPDRFEKGVLYSSSEKIPQASIEVMQTTGTLFANGVDPALCFRTVVPWLFGSTFLSHEGAIDQVIKHMMEDPYPTDPQGMAGQFTALSAHDGNPILPEITTPLLVFAGSEDVSTPLYCATALAEKLPHNKLHVAPGVGHTCHLENLPHFVSTVTSFLSK